MMKLKDNIFTTLLLTIGLILHYITPGILGGMKFDFLLIFVIISILLNSRFENCLLSGLLGGILSAMTTTFPGGQIPNILDKLISCLILFVIVKAFHKFTDNILVVGLIGGIGTLFSGIVFLITAKWIVGLPASIVVLIVSVVLPTVIINGVGTAVIYKVVKTALKFSGVAIG